MPSVITPCGGGSGVSGLKFVTYPQAGQWFYAETNGPDTSPSGFGFEWFDDSGNGVNFSTAGGGPILFKASGGGDITLQQNTPGAAIKLIGNLKLIGGFIDALSLPTVDPGVSGRLWNDGGVLSVSP